ncbi:ABC transporter ATP-binding protein [Pseudokineococcus sp. 5B2Z-1]|uniref:ABC transporter ATP-binding protein n=1 Tax=Pseudokineococcus sp. 5B2Z-1 TaxID=3132744 RepID=UPI0030AD8533
MSAVPPTTTGPTPTPPTPSAAEAAAAAVEVTGLRVDGTPSHAAIIDEVELRMRRGEVLGVVGESGSGKSTLALALLRYLKRSTELVAGTVSVGGEDLTALDDAGLRRARGRSVAYVPQSPAASLNPALRIGTQLRECLPGGSSERVREVLREVALPDDGAFRRRYPHQLSGGQQQRVALAMAFAARPSLIVLDEPTTGLDVTTQKHVLSTVRGLCAEHGVAAVYISHDIAVVADIADRVAVMYSGRLVEVAPTAELLAAPQHPYTVGLLGSAPDPAGERAALAVPGVAPSPLQRPRGCAYAPRCPVAVDACSDAPPAAVENRPGQWSRCLRPGEHRLEPRRRDDGARLRVAHAARPVVAVRDLVAWYDRSAPVLRGVDLEVRRGECLALLGESGSGKTTLSRSVAGLHRRLRGAVELDGEPLAAGVRRRTSEQRRRVQYVFQDPYESLNPRRTVREIVTAPVRQLLGRRPDEAERVRDVLMRVSLRPEHADRLPGQLSGGERQRVAIARALAVEPDVLVCDEITSALDVSVQAAITDLLAHLQRDLGLTMLFVTHDTALVRDVAQSVAVLSRGRLVEHGPVDTVFTDPQHEYTRTLMADTPRLDLAGALA